MLDTFEIITTNGVVLWSRTYAPVNPSVVNNFISDTFIEEKNGSTPKIREHNSAVTNPAYKSDQHTLKWAMVKEMGVIFVVRKNQMELRRVSLSLIFLGVTGRLPVTTTP